MRLCAEKKPRPRLGFFSPAQKGFTLVELIVVIVVAGILLAVAVPRFTGNTGFEERGLRDETAAALRYAQKAAIAARRTVCVTFTATGLTARIATNPGATVCTTGAALGGPSGTPLAVVARGSVSYTAPAAGAVLNFNALGQPSSALLISVAYATDLTVEAETGYVH